jgi:PAS domain S-box-containing protein
MIALNARPVVEDLRRLSKAENDDVRWNIAQIEVELLRAQTAAQSSSESGLREFRQRYDIFFSRANGLISSLRRYDLLQVPQIVKGQRAAAEFLATYTPIVDSRDAELHAAMPKIIWELKTLRPQVRQLALAGVAHFAERDAALRERIWRTLLRLAGMTLAMIASLAALVILLMQMYRNSVRVGQEKQVITSRLDAMIRSALDAVVVVDQCGEIIEFNQAACTMFGYSREQALGRRFTRLLFEPEQSAHLDQALHRALRSSGNAVRRMRGQARGKDGTIIPIEYTVTSAKAGDMHVGVSYLRDITLDLQRESELRNARDLARQGEKTKSDLLTVMSHEMRTPLNGIMGALSLIKRRGLSERDNRHLDAIAVSSELLLTHVNNVLSLSRLEADAAGPAPNAMDLRDVVSKTVASLEASAQDRGNALDLRLLFQGPGVVQGDKTGLQQCLVNLIGNAIKFTRDGDIMVEVEQIDDDGTFEFRVSDTGVGIADDEQDRIFDEFVMADMRHNRDSAGTGLGLSITRRLAQRMGGDVSVQSLLGEGSLFTLSLPLPATSAPDSLPSPQSFEGEGKAGHILVVDDNEINRMVLVDMLEDLGLSSLEAEDGFQALEQLQSTRFDAVLMDISMPGLDGFETLHRLRDLHVGWSDLPVIAATALTQPKDRDAIFQAGFAGLLTKPISPEDLSNALCAVLDCPDRKDSSLARDFAKRFGEQAAAKALTTFARDADVVITAANAPDPDIEALREPVHRLAGSAGVLDLAEIMQLLQKLENAAAQDWPALVAQLQDSLTKAGISR